MVPFEAVDPEKIEKEKKNVFQLNDIALEIENTIRERASDALPSANQLVLVTATSSRGQILPPEKN